MAHLRNGWFLVIATLVAATVSAAAESLPWRMAPAFGIQPVVDPVVVVVNAGNPVSSLTLREVQDFFRGERQHWARGKPAMVVVPPVGTLERTVAMRVLYGMTERAYVQYWTERVFRAQSVSAPVPVDLALVGRAVANLSGAIGVTTLSRVESGVKVLVVDGAGPSSTHYPLR
jgi:ABC-type phosphate transport system substrate-binding protein